jgi:phosphatidylserine decarboxylase
VNDRIEVTGDGERGANVQVKSTGPWQVRVLGALPLRSLSQLWGYLNGLVLPVWFRPFGFKLYARIFGCNLEECEEQDLTKYKSLGEFFYRTLKPGLRPIDTSAQLVSPADGTVLHFGEISGERVEQVKGMTYSLNALLGVSGNSVNQPDQLEFVKQDGRTVDGKSCLFVQEDIHSSTHVFSTPLTQTKSLLKSTTFPIRFHPSSAHPVNKSKSRNNLNTVTLKPA